MVMKRHDSVAAYIAAQPKRVQAALRGMRAAIRKTVPAAVEGMSYGIPGYKLDGRVLLYFAAWKEHFAVYPATAGVQAACERELAKYHVGKGTIRFPIDEAAPLRLVAKIAKLRAGEVAAAARARAKR
jgi:uncharacterized protein YdhG (YjbR/CyaY superfamily)